MKGQGSSWLSAADGSWTWTLPTDGWEPGVYCFMFTTNVTIFDTVGADYRPVVLFTVGDPESKDICKDGGWKATFDVDTYKNQGQCVSEFVKAQ